MSARNGHRHLPSVWFTARFPFAENLDPRVAFSHRKRLPARIPAGKKILNISLAVGIRLPLHLAHVWT
jgi:hypothetical protein